MNKNTEKIKERYNRVSKIYDVLEKSLEAMTMNGEKKLSLQLKEKKF